MTGRNPFNNLRAATPRGCGCFTCTKKRVADNPLPVSEMVFNGGIDPRMSRYFLCETCGNKRCPHATSHKWECTGSNAPGQKGSVYE